MSQMDIFGGGRPVEELHWPATLQALAAHERELGARLSADEAGAWLHARRGKHDEETRCDYCTTDGRDLLDRLRERRPLDEAAGQLRSPRLADNPAASSSGPCGTSGAGPRARSTDPETSHAAAASVAARDLRESHRAIADLLEANPGGLTDERLVDLYLGSEREPYQSPSGIRTRRDELVQAGLVRDSGRKATLSTGRRGIVWERVHPPVDPLEHPRDDPEPAL